MPFMASFMRSRPARLTAQSVFQSLADRDGMCQSGMEGGVNDSYNRLDELLEKMKHAEM